MSNPKKRFIMPLFGVSILGIAIGFAYNNVASSYQWTGNGSLLQSRPGANLEVDSEISFFCVRDDELIKVSMARSMARKREGSWYLPGYDQCF